MIEYFIKNKNISEVTKIKSLLNSLKERISTQDYNNAFDELEEALPLFDDLKRIALQKHDEQLANSQWVFKCYFHFFANLSSYISLLQEQKYADSWIKLQDCIDNATTVSRFCSQQSYDINYLTNLLYEYEKLYPYTHFLSSEYVYKKSECSICGKSTLDLDCSHLFGELYWGECAHEIISEIEIIQAIAVVENPKDKRCVLNLQNNISELERFKALNYIFPQTDCHLLDFRVKKEIMKKRNKEIPKLGRNEICFCGSEKKFKECCMKNLYYDHHHFQIIYTKKIELLYFN